MQDGKGQIPMTDEESYCFDVSGFVIVRAALSAAELTAFNCAIDRMLDGDGGLPPTAAFRYPFLQLRDHPVLIGYANALCGDEYRHDTGPELLKLDGEADARLGGGGEWLDWSRAYFHRNGVRHCQGLTAVWALADVHPGDGGLALIAASHNSNVETPDEVLTGADDLGLPEQPAMQAGDLLLCASSLVRGVRAWRGSGPGRLLTYGFVSRSVRPHDWSNLDAAGRREWAGELTPVQQALLHDPRRRGEPAVVRRLGDDGGLRLQRGIFHPSIYIRDPNSEIDDREFYYWDLCGHLVLKAVMDAGWLAAASEAIEANVDRVETMAGITESDSNRLRGTHRERLHEVWDLPQPYCEPFRRMIADPEITARLNWMMGSGYEATKCEILCSRPGGSGHMLHAGGDTESETNHYTFRNGRCYCEYINVAWQLRSVSAADGGFCCVPGSHKSPYPMPEGVRSADADMEMIRHVGMEAGDVLLFLAGAQTHGALPWTGKQDRRSVLMQYRSRNLSWEYSAATRRRM